MFQFCYDDKKSTVKRHLSQSDLLNLIAHANTYLKTKLNLFLKNYEQQIK